MLRRVGDSREREYARDLAGRRWRAWLQASWPALVRGDKVTVPPGQLPRPSLAGYRGLRVSENAGQVADWGLSLVDGSRVHLHEYASGRLVAHRDRFDPGRNLYALGRHVVGETRVGKTAAVGAVLWGVARAVQAVGRIL